MARTFSDGVEGQPGVAPESTLASGIAIGATSCAVQSGHGARFPSTGDFSIRFEDTTDPTQFENVTATARSTDTITHGATTYAWDAGDKVMHAITKADLDAFAETADLTAYQALSAYDANTILKADSDNTPVALTVAEQTLLGRITGGSIDDLSVAQVLTLLGFNFTKLKAGMYYGTPVSGVTTAAHGSGYLYAVPFHLMCNTTFDRIAVEVTTGIASAVLRLGLYANHATELKPGALLWEAGTIDASSTGIKTVTINQPLTPGIYWLGALGETAGASFRATTGTPASWTPHDIFSATRAGFYRLGVAAGSLPNPWGTPSADSSSVLTRVMMRAV